MLDEVEAAFARALESERAAGTYNIGTGHATSVNTVYERISHAMACQSAVRHVAPVVGERYSIADIGAVGRELGYEPDHRIDAGIAAIVAEIVANTRVNVAGSN